MIRRLLLLAFAATLSACAFGEDEGKNTRDAEDLRERGELRESYNSVIGTWTGTLKDSLREEPVEMRFYILEEATGGRDSDGRIITRPVLYGRLQSTEFVRFDATFSARYYNVTGELALFKQASGGGQSAQQGQQPGQQQQSGGASAGTDDIKSIQGTLRGSTYTGRVLSSNGQIGEINLRLTSRQADAPGSDDDLELAERLRRQFAKVTGTWDGEITDGVRAEKIRVVFFVQEERGGTNSSGEIVTRPVLYARLRTLDIVRFDVTYSTRYRPEINEITLLNSEAELQSIVGTVGGPEERPTYTGEARTTQGLFGKFTLTRQSTETPAPGEGERNELNERLRRQYAPFVGKYRGKVMSETRPERNGFDVEIYLSNVQTSTGELIPALVANYHLNEAVMDLTLAITYRPETRPPQMVMSSPQNSRPGNYYVTMDTKFCSGKIFGLHMTQRGVSGEFILTKTSGPALPDVPCPAGTQIPKMEDAANAAPAVKPPKPPKPGQVVLPDVGPIPPRRPTPQELANDEVL